ncbi:Glycosyl transferase, group 1 [hydrothermal vent metagenome]|uniref:Glycosyl transferase, group 1 n=1 Tax=hydrothermal vent metagenome TaxID=652676 RepID=A0A3B0XXZ0_9ZZZZ
MQISLYNKLEDIPIDKEQWRKLLARNTTRSVFQSYAWTHNWWEQFGNNYTLFFLVAQNNDGQVSGLAPLMLDESRTLRFIADKNSDYLDFIIPDDRSEILSAFFKKIREQQHDWLMIELNNIRRCSDLLDHVKRICNSSNMYFWRNGTIDAPSLIIDGNEKHTERLLKKYSTRRAEKQFSRQGEISFTVFRSREQAAPYWKAFFTQHIDRCGSVNRGSSFIQPAFRRFARELFEQTLEEHTVHFSVLELNGKPIAFHYGFISENRLVWYKPCFDTKIKKGSPGLLLIKRLIEHCVDNKLQELDFTIGAEAFKDRFCSIRRRVDSARIYKSRTRYFTECILHMMWDAVKHTLRKLFPGTNQRKADSTRN